MQLSEQTYLSTTTVPYNRVFEVIANALSNVFFNFFSKAMYSQLLPNTIHVSPSVPYTKDFAQPILQEQYVQSAGQYPLLLGIECLSLY